MTDDLDEIPVLVISNEPTETKARTLELIYQSIASGQLAYADARDPDTGEIVPLLVGLEPVEGQESQFHIYPLAKLMMTEAEIKEYEIADGAGGYSTGNFGDTGDEPVTFFGETEAGSSEGNDEGPTVH